jgi:nitrite reductase/ring-hydroxylating ferredoxin subunit
MRSPVMSDQRSTRREFLRCGCAALGVGFLGLESGGVRTVTAAGLASDRQRSYPVPASDGVTVDRDSLVFLIRVGSRVCACALTCPHQAAAVKWVEKDGRFQCTKHTSRFGSDGVRLSGVASRNLDRFAIRRDADAVVVDLDRVFRSDKDPAGWDSAIITV